VDAAKADLPIVLLTEPQPGKNRALNKGLQEVEGHLAIVTDDDAIPDRMFLKAWEKYLDSKSNYALFGGSVRPLFEASPPKWFPSNEHWSAMMFASRHLPEGPIQPDQIYGPNMAVRTAIFSAGFRFDETFGPNELDPYYPTGSETEFCWRIARSGAQCWFANEPVVSHVVSAHQITSQAMERRAYRLGRGRARLSLRSAQLITSPMPTFRQRIALFSPFARHRFESRCAYQIWRGFQDECAPNDQGLEAN